MDDRNTVTVKIFGQEYTISGDMPREYIMRVADYVDSKMSEIGENSTNPVSWIAVLSAINITDELFRTTDERNDLYNKNLQYQTDAAKYEKLWDEAQRSLAQTREREQDTTDLYTEINNLRKQNDALKGKLQELSDQLEHAQNAPEEANEMIRQLEAKCRDTESSFFDLQMENIHLKNELEALKRQAR